MRRHGLAYIAAILLSSAANAQDGPIRIDQHGDKSQVANNVLQAGTLEALTDNFMAQMLRIGVTGTVSQSGANAINSVQYDGDLDRVVQHFNGTQSINNTLALGVVDVSGSVSQTGTNIANSTRSVTLNFANQTLGIDAKQLVDNSAEFGILFGSVTQSGRNIANNAVADLAIGTASQLFPTGAEQRVDNRLELAAMSAIASAVSQRGENFGNIMISDEVDQVTRNFAGEQIVHNVVHLADGAPGTIEQYGINVANMITSSKIGSLSQTSTGRQEVINEVFDAQNTLLTGGNITQSSDNYVNLIVLTAPADGGSNAIISVDQSANYPQDASGNGAHSQTGNALTVNR
ncbi:hypothetical protein IC608_13995 [Devosia sp. PTR5]|uniref:Curlin associated repeat-containing protein n=1 Tax=Devosia oryzisoli TaxID=2774138 RepID=A0A927FXF8_9HYPH|nr:hypothetical protein [Devosia oryzisoli]MBD8066583.1 hypothetical protein [Devosia oryzisoli]